MSSPLNLPSRVMSPPLAIVDEIGVEQSGIAELGDLGRHAAADALAVAQQLDVDLGRMPLQTRALVVEIQRAADEMRPAQIAQSGIEVGLAHQPLQGVGDEGRGLPQPRVPRRQELEMPVLVAAEMEVGIVDLDIRRRDQAAQQAAQAEVDPDLGHAGQDPSIVGQGPHMGGAQSDQPLAARPGDDQIVELDVHVAARRRQRPLDIGNEKLQMERLPLGKAIGGEAGHDDQPGDQCADDLEPETQAADEPNRLSLTRKREFISLPATMTEHHARLLAHSHRRPAAASR